MDSELAKVATCPVCGDIFSAAPRRCPRCDTPHHAECWDYVPGCAVFGCADASPPAILEWPWAHRILATRARLTSWIAHALQAGILAFGVAASLPKAHHFPVLYVTIAAMAVLFVAIPARVAVEVAYWMSPARETLQHALQQGDRRLQKSIERRVGALLPIASWKLAWSLGALMIFPLFVRDSYLWWTTGAKMNPLALAVIAVILSAGFGFAVFLPGLWLAERLLGSQRVLVNRLEASRNLPEKPQG